MTIDLDLIKLPKKINPCPIIESIVELRFDSQIPQDAIFGIVYNEFKKEYSNLQELPILQLPEMVRKTDPNLRYKPYYKLTSEDNKFIFQIGGRVYSLINTRPYDGWAIFFGKIKDLISRLKKMSIIDYYTRIGIRYINGFDFNILEKVNLSINLSDTNLKDYESAIRINVPSNKFISTLQVINDALIKKIDTVTNIKGSVIDIDTYIENPKNDIVKNIEEGHLEEKKLFFSLLNEEFINKELNPEY